MTIPIIEGPPGRKWPPFGGAELGRPPTTQKINNHDLSSLHFLNASFLCSCGFILEYASLTLIGTTSLWSATAYSVILPVESKKKGKATTVAKMASITMMEFESVVATIRRIHENLLRLDNEITAARMEQLEEISQPFIELGHKFSELNRLGDLIGESAPISKPLLEKARQIASRSPAMEHILSGLINVLESLCRLSFRHFLWPLCG